MTETPPGTRYDTRNSVVGVQGSSSGPVYQYIGTGNAPAERQRIRFTIEDLPGTYVPRVQEINALIHALLNPAGTNSVAITTALRGAGGYGKTTLARAVCHDPRVRQAFDNQIVWITLGEQPGDLTTHLNDLIEHLTGQRPGFVHLEHASARLAALLDDDPPLLLVIDDVWQAAHLKPFMRGGARCTRLVTTRHSDTLPHTVHPIPVDAMRQDEAVALLGAGLPLGEITPLRQLATRLGEWPLLLTLVNGILRDRVARHQPLRDALNYVTQALDKRGVVAFDARNTADAVRSTLDISLNQLATDERARYTELAVFAEDSDIPLSIVAQFWDTTGGLDVLETEELCAKLERHSLLQRFDLATRTIRLHDVVRAYLIDTQVSDFTTLHGRLLNAYAIDLHAHIHLDERYLWHTLASHLAQAKRLDDLRTLLTNGSYLQGKITHFGTARLLEDFAWLPDEKRFQTLARTIRLAAHVLNRAPNELANQIHGRGGTKKGELHTIPPFVAPAFELLSPTMVAPGGPLLQIFTGHTGGVIDCAFSLDGHTALSASSDNTLRLWDVESSQTIRVLEGHTSEVNACALSPDGHTALSASHDRTLRLWDVESGQTIRVLEGHRGGVNACALSPDGHTALSASHDRTLRLWDVESGQTIRVLEGHTSGVMDCAFSPDGHTALSASLDATLHLWDVESGQTIHILEGHTGEVNACALSPDGHTALSASLDATLRLWDVESGQTIRVLEGHKDTVWDCMFSPDGHTALSASHDRTLRLWDVESGQTIRVLEDYPNMVMTCSFSPDGRTALSASYYGTLRLWDVESSQTIRVLESHRDTVSACMFSPDGRTALSASHDRTLRLWDVESGQTIHILEGHRGGVNACAFSPDGRTALSASHDRTLRLWDVESGQTIHILEGHTGPVLSTPTSITIRLWDVKSGQTIYVIRDPTIAVWDCAFSPDGRTALSASSDNTLRLWDVESGQTIHILEGHTDPVMTCTFSPDGRTALSASYRGALHLWDVESGRTIHILEGHTGGMNACTFSPDGRTALSTSSDNTLRLWNIENGTEAACWNVDASLWCSRFHPDGQRVIAGDSLGMVHFLRLHLP